jgi:hypothetical protein
VRCVSTSRHNSSRAASAAGLDRPYAVAGEDLVEDAGELGVAVPDQEAKGADPAAEVYEQVARLLGGPRVVCVGDHPEDVHVPGPHLHDEQHVQAPEEDRVDVEEITGQQAFGLRAQECPPRRVHPPRDRSPPPGAQDPPHGRRADAVPEPA